MNELSTLGFFGSQNVRNSVRDISDQTILDHLRPSSGNVDSHPAFHDTSWPRPRTRPLPVHYHLRFRPWHIWRQGAGWSHGSARWWVRWDSKMTMGHGWTWMDMDGHGWTWMDMDGHGWTWMDMDGHGWTWMDMANHGTALNAALSRHNLDGSWGKYPPLIQKSWQFNGSLHIDSIRWCPKIKLIVDCDESLWAFWTTSEDMANARQLTFTFSPPKHHGLATVSNYGLGYISMV